MEDQMIEAASILEITPTMIAGEGLENMPPWPEDKIEEGLRSHRNREVFLGTLAVGIYSADDGRLLIPDPYPVDEVVYVIQGMLTLRDALGEQQVFQAGDWLFVGKGFTGSWDMRGDFREIHIVAGSDAPGDVGQGLPPAEVYIPHDQQDLTTNVRHLAHCRLSEGLPTAGLIKTQAEVGQRDLSIRTVSGPVDRQAARAVFDRLIYVASGAIRCRGSVLNTGAVAIISKGELGSVLIEEGTVLLEVADAKSASPSQSDFTFGMTAANILGAASSPF
jgi:uncharacterized cupin superfamily protein